ncbi:unnamed protein product [Cuscuta campestris]|uniref:Uncharacterized protein n=1 Tax=Cuscuta campestris TaxID=132261 RepID=A0A484MQB7_9ASTE|nr:unnamed protein product [Cuscuta campestris]
MPLFSCPGIVYNHEFKTKRRTLTGNGDMIEETVLPLRCVHMLELCVKRNIHISEGLFYPSLNNHVKKIRVFIEARILLINLPKFITTLMNYGAVLLRVVAAATPPPLIPKFMGLEPVTTAELALKIGNLLTPLPPPMCCRRRLRVHWFPRPASGTSADFRHSLDALRAVSSSRFHCNEQGLSPDHLLCVMMAQCKVDQTDEEEEGEADEKKDEEKAKNERKKKLGGIRTMPFILGN